MFTFTWNLEDLRSIILCELAVNTESAFVDLVRSGERIIPWIPIEYSPDPEVFVETEDGDQYTHTIQ